MGATTAETTSVNAPDRIGELGSLTQLPSR